MAIPALFDEQRTAQAAAFFLHKAGGQMSKVKLMKLLYLAERESYRRYGEPISGDTLLSTPGGPVLSTTQNLMADVDKTDVHAALAAELFKNGQITSARAAKLAGMTLPQFLDYLSAQGIPVVDYTPEELDQELTAFDVHD